MQRHDILIDDKGIVKLDFANAFNSVRRDALFTPG